jgi:hypothetical protein
MEDGGKRKKKHGFCYKRVCILKEPHFAKNLKKKNKNPTLHKLCRDEEEEEEFVCLSLFQGCRGEE